MEEDHLYHDPLAVLKMTERTLNIFGSSAILHIVIEQHPLIQSMLLDLSKLYHYELELYFPNESAQFKHNNTDSHY